jgi:hypothetical protein
LLLEERRKMPYPIRKVEEIKNDHFSLKYLLMASLTTITLLNMHFSTVDMFLCYCIRNILEKQFIHRYAPNYAWNTSFSRLLSTQQQQLIVVHSECSK